MFNHVKGYRECFFNIAKACLNLIITIVIDLGLELAFNITNI